MGKCYFNIVLKKKHLKRLNSSTGKYLGWSCFRGLKLIDWNFVKMEEFKFG